MLYLAEVLRKTRVIGGGKAEFKLLACQRGEQSWCAVPGEDIIPAPDDAAYSAGALVMLDLSASKQVQRHGEAGRQLVSILQNFSRLQEKAKNQEEEIEQWKQSLTYQSQELSRREMEMEARQEQLQQMEEDFEKLEQQRQDVEGAKTDLDRLRADVERRSQELEGAWAQLRGAENRLDEKQAELQGAAVLDQGQAHALYNLLDRISAAVAPTEAIQEQLNRSFELIAQQQNTLDPYWQTLEQRRHSAQQAQDEADRQTQELHERWQTWHHAQAALEQANADLSTKRSTLTLQQDHARFLAAQLQTQDSLHQQIVQMAEPCSRIDAAALEQLSLDELHTVVKDLEKDLEKLSRFVHSQEEELTLQQEAITELQHQIQQASEYDRLRLETELADEQDRYKMLNQTLVGQRRNLLERQTVCKQHEIVLAKRSGQAIDEEQSRAIDLEPVLTNSEKLRRQQVQELQAIESQIQQLQQAIEQAESAIQQQTSAQATTRDELKSLEQQLRAQVAAAGELWGNVNTYQAMLHPIQEPLNELRQKAEAIASVMTQFQEASSYQMQAVHELRHTVQQLTGNPAIELAAS